MENFFKIIANHPEFFFFIMMIETLLIIILVIYILNKIENERKTNRVLSGRNDKMEREISLWREEYNTLWNKYNIIYREFEEQKNKKEIWRNEQKPHSKRDNYRPHFNSNNESDNGLSEYVNNEKKKLNRVQEIINDDGSIKTEIDFPLPDNMNTPDLTTHKYEYLETANGGQFRKLLPSDEKSFFRTWEENGIRKFEFHGNVDKALANFNAVFDDVCLIEGKQNGATQITNLDPGVLTSQLKVDIPAKIKLS